MSGRIVKLKTFVKPSRIPFLLGIEALTKINAIINPAKEEITLCGQKLNSNGNTNGHFVLEVVTTYETKQTTEQWVFQFSDEIDQNRRKDQMINKMHVKFGHAPPH